MESASCGAGLHELALRILVVLGHLSFRFHALLLIRAVGIGRTNGQPYIYSILQFLLDKIDFILFFLTKKKETFNQIWVVIIFLRRKIKP